MGSVIKIGNKTIHIAKSDLPCRELDRNRLI